MKKIILIVLFVITSAYSEILIGGQVASRDKFRSTVSFLNCTGSKIGTRLILIAGHCVTNSSFGIVLYRKGFQGTMKSHSYREQLVNIEKVYVHDSYLSYIRKSPGSGGAFKSFDVAVIVTSDDIEGVEVGKISYKYIEPTEKVIIGGFGCISRDREENLKGELKVAKTIVASPSSIDKDYHARDISEANAFNFYTYGKTEFGISSLCPGDSGGPAYSLQDGSIVGVNSQYIFNDKSGVSFLNTHTRLSEVQKWLKNIIASHK